MNYGGFALILSKKVWRQPLIHSCASTQNKLGSRKEENRERIEKKYRSEPKILSKQANNNSLALTDSIFW